MRLTQEEKASAGSYSQAPRNTNAAARRSRSRAMPTLSTADPTPEKLALPSWQAELKDAVRDPAELLRLLELPPDALGQPASTPFPLLVPRGFVARMRKGDASDPLLRQVWPAAAELTPVAGFSADPVREQGLAAHGLIQKYAGRA